MRVRLAFQQAVDERFLVTAELVRGKSPDGQGQFSVTAFEDENDFIQQVVLAGLAQEDTTALIAGVLLTLANRGQAQPWIPLTLTAAQILGLRLELKPDAQPAPELTRDELTQLHHVIMQTPTPLVVMSGPQHRFTFCNTAYAELMQRTDISQIIGRTVREVLPELKGQPFLKQLDDVFRTGKEFIGRETPGTLRNSVTGKLEQHFFDFIYYPVRDAGGAVTAIVAQATDVTANVLARQVSESREEQLYKQWAELDTIYRYSPMAMCLLNAGDFRILRCNELTAEQFSLSAEEMIGKRMIDLLPDLPILTELYERVHRGEVIRNFELTLELPPTSGVIRTWLLTLSPLFTENGVVGAIESIATEVTDRIAVNISSLATANS